MRKRDIYSRVKANLADLDLATLFCGSGRQTLSGEMFEPRDAERLARGRRRMERDQIGSRLFVVDRADLSAELSASTIHTIVEQAKERVGAKRALVIVDYLQILPVPEWLSGQNEIEQDRYRVRTMQAIVDQSTTEEDPLGHAVLFISETRKPANSKDQWGASLSEFMGTARLTYAIDYALIYRRMQLNEMERFYNVFAATAEEHRTSLERRGIAPVVVTLEKARDGMTKGDIALEFHYRRSQHKALSEPEDGLVQTPNAEISTDDRQLLDQMDDIGVSNG
jgi:hypothetical protein